MELGEGGAFRAKGRPMKDKITLKSEYMREALTEAELALEAGEVPVGAVVVKDGAIVARGHNLTESRGDASMHAELIALRGAAQALGRWRLSDCELYVTLEPCAMCMGAILNFRVGALCFGAFDKEAGCAVSRVELGKATNGFVPYAGGMLEKECAELLARFFKAKRQE